MIDERDAIKPLSQHQIGSFLDDLSGWAPPHTMLADALRKRTVLASALVRADMEMPENLDFTEAPFYPVRYSSIDTISKYCFDRLKQNEFCNYICFFNYIDDFVFYIETATVPPYAKDILDRGGRIHNIEGPAVFVMPTESVRIEDIAMTQENFFSPVVGFREDIFGSLSMDVFEQSLDMYCNIFDDETMVYVKSVGSL